MNQAEATREQSGTSKSRTSEKHARTGIKKTLIKKERRRGKKETLGKDKGKTDRKKRQRRKKKESVSPVSAVREQAYGIMEREEEIRDQTRTKKPSPRRPFLYNPDPRTRAISNELQPPESQRMMLQV